DVPAVWRRANADDGLPAGGLPERRDGGVAGIASCPSAALALLGDADVAGLRPWFPDQGSAGLAAAAGGRGRLDPGTVATCEFAVPLERPAGLRRSRLALVSRRHPRYAGL